MPQDFKKFRKPTWKFKLERSLEFLRSKKYVFMFDTLSISLVEAFLKLFTKC